MQQLPVTEVVLYRNGVGQFVHEGTVSGDAALTLTVAESDLDDLLASLVVADPEGGAPSVTYPARDPLRRVLDSYALNLSEEPGLLDLLRQATGEAVSIEADQPLHGLLLGIDIVDNPRGPEASYLTVSTDAGLRRLELGQLQSLTFTNPRVQHDLDAALRAIADHRGTDQRHVTISLRGQGERPVRIAYLRAVPVWKTSHRISLDADGTGRLQGWAIVDNPTDLDLTEVSLALVAGAPTSFTTSLAEPRHVARPRVEIDLPTAVEPRHYARDAAVGAGPSARAALAAKAPTPMMAEAASFDAFDVEADVTADELGLNTIYRIAEPVTIPRHSSTMVPFVTASVPVTPLSVFDADAGGVHPQRALRLRNTTGGQVAGGPLTVYDEGGFVGSAVLPDLQPDAVSVVTHALDLAVRVHREVGVEQSTETLTLVDGALRSSRTVRRPETFTVTSEAPETRVVMIVVRPDDEELAHPGPEPLANGDERHFGVVVEGTQPGDTPGDLPIQATGERSATLALEYRRPVSYDVALLDADAPALRLWVERGDLTAEQRDALAQLADLGARITAITTQRQTLLGRRDGIIAGQERIRENMKELARDSDLYRRYVRDLGTQEDELDALASQADALETEVTDLREQQAAIIRRLAG